MEEDFVMVETSQEASVPVVNGTNHLDFISKYTDEHSSGLRQLSLAIHDNPELGYKEHHAHKVLTEFLDEQGYWTVTRSAYEINTAFVAVYESKEKAGEKKPAVVSFNVEYDALPGIGHACGHNLIAVASLAGAMAAQAVMSASNLPGKVVIFGTPAEEGGGGKIKLLNAGAYKEHEVDLSLISHPGITPDCALVRSSAYYGFKVEYYGKEAHAAAAPWQGINALDALITAYNSISVLRQQTHPDDIIQGQITNGGLKPNIIHAYSSAQFVVRSGSRERREALRKRVIACFEAGATATGATLKITPQKYPYDDMVPNRVLGRLYRNAFNNLGGSIPTPDIDIIRGATSASSDQGNVSYAMPSISAGFWIRSEDEEGKQLSGPHTPDFEKAARTEEAHDLAMRVGKALASTALDVIESDNLLEEIKKEFEDLEANAT